MAKFFRKFYYVYQVLYCYWGLLSSLLKSFLCLLSFSIHLFDAYTVWVGGGGVAEETWYCHCTCIMHVWRIKTLTVPEQKKGPEETHWATTVCGLKSSHLDKVVGEEASLPVEVALHPALLLDVPHVLDHFTQPQRQLVLVKCLVLVLHHHLCSETQREEREREGGEDSIRLVHCPQMMIFFPARTCN